MAAVMAFGATAADAAFDSVTGIPRSAAMIVSAKTMVGAQFVFEANHQLVGFFQNSAGAIRDLVTTAMAGP